MKQNNFPLRAFTGMAVCASMIISSCNNNDTNTTESTMTDSAKMMTDTTPKMPVVDSGAMMPSATDTSAMSGKGMAKPNAAKKGMKGKVSFMSPAMPPASTTGSMTPDASGVYSSVDHIPAFPGGNAGLQKFFDDNVQYPTIAQDEGVEGVVNVSFTVDENGKIIAPMVEGDKQGYGLDNEAVRVVNKMPSWVPGKINGKPVKTKFTLPVKFALAN